MTDKIKRFAKSGRTDSICIYRHNHILLQGLKNIVGRTIYCCHEEDGWIGSIATNVEVISVFANTVL